MKNKKERKNNFENIQNATNNGKRILKNAFSTLFSFVDDISVNTKKRVPDEESVDYDVEVINELPSIINNFPEDDIFVMYEEDDEEKFDTEEVIESEFEEDTDIEEVIESEFEEDTDIEEVIESEFEEDIDTEEVIESELEEESDTEEVIESKLEEESNTEETIENETEKNFDIGKVIQDSIKENIIEQEKDIENLKSEFNKASIQNKRSVLVSGIHNYLDNTINIEINYLSFDDRMYEIFCSIVILNNRLRGIRRIIRKENKNIEYIYESEIISENLYKEKLNEIVSDALEHIKSLKQEFIVEFYYDMDRYVDTEEIMNEFSSIEFQIKSKQRELEEYK